MDRVLHCIWTLGSGGAERQLSYLCPQLAARGWDVHVAHLYGGPNLDPLKRGGVTVHQLEAASRRDVALILQLRKLTRQIRPKLIQTWLTQMDLIGGVIALGLGIPWILSERTSGEYYRGFVNGVRGVLGRRATVVVANSMEGIRYWTALRNESHPSVLIRNAVPLREIDLVAAASDLEAGKRLILFVGRLSVEKNVERLAEALAIVFHRTTDTVAFICGEGELDSSLKQNVTNLGIADRVRFCGYVPAIWSWMKRASVLVAPSIFEGHPNVVIEAMACRTPLVVSDIAAHREFLDESSAVFVLPERSDSIAEGILRVLSFPEEAAERSIHARRAAESWSLDRIASEYDLLYRQILQTAP